LLTVHGRTKCQGYAGVADWEQVGRVKAAVSVPVLCNGDIHRAKLVPEALRQSGCDGVLIARGALGNPWIFAQIEDVLAGRAAREISVDERLRVIGRHLDLHLEQYGPNAIRTFRKHLSWYFKGQPGAKQFREALHTAPTREDLERVMSEFHVCASAS